MTDKMLRLPALYRKSIMFVLILTMATGLPTFAQVSTRILSVSPVEAVGGAPLTITAELQQTEGIEQIYFVFRPFGVSEWKNVEMELRGNRARVSLPASVVVPPFIEYYLVIGDRAGTLETYPLSESANPLTSPPAKTLQLPVRTRDASSLGVIFLNPEPDSYIAADEALISFSLLRVDTMVVKRATQVLINDIDVTNSAMFTDDIVVLVPENAGVKLRPGLNRVLVRLFNREGALHSTASVSFSVGRAEASAMVRSDGPTYRGSVDLESRNEFVNNASTWYNRAGLHFNAQTGSWRFTGNAFITSDELPSRQPQNRYFAGVESPWLKLGYGDVYPIFPSLILSGKRVRGLNSSLKLGFFNVDFTMGKTVRNIEGTLLKMFSADSLAAEQSRDSAAAYGKIDANNWGKFSYGTYERDLFAVRPSFGSGETYQWGFTLLKAKDDVGSIQYGIRPQENVVLGTDFVARIADNLVEFTAQAAFSAYNADISSGSFTDAYIDSVYKKDADAIKSARNILQKFITVNDNLRPLSLKKLSTLAYETGLGLNVLNNSLKFTYLFRGSDYNSFGQTFLRKDIQGFNIVDRIRLANNQVFVTLGYEQLTDNTSGTKKAATTFLNYNVSVSYFSRSNARNVTVGYARFNNENGLATKGIDSSSAINDNTNRFFVQSSYGFTWGIPHHASLNVSTSSREDASIRKLNVKNTTVALGLITQFTIPLETNLEYSLNLNDIPGQIAGALTQLNYSTLSLHGKYRLMNDRLSLMATVAPTFGDFKRTVFDAGSQWQFVPNMSLVLKFSYFKNDGVPNDSFWSLRYRVDV